MYSVLDIGSYLYSVSNKKISELKLQRVCYYIQREYINSTGEPLFSEDFEVWENGIVCRELFNCDIKKYKGEQLSDDVKSLIDGVYSKYKDSSDIDLIILGEEDKLWKYVREHKGKGAILSKELIKGRGI